MLQRTNQTTETTKDTYTQTPMYTKKEIHKISTTSSLVYNNMGRLGDGGQVRQAWTAVGPPPPRYNYQCNYIWLEKLIYRQWLTEQKWLS